MGPSLRLALDIMSAPTTERLVPVTPETIEDDYDYKISVIGLPRARLRGDVTRALETCAIERVDDRGPLYCRWALIFYDLKGERVFTMYLNGSGNGSINGTRVLVDAEVMRILRRGIASLWE